MVPDACRWVSSDFYMPPPGSLPRRLAQLNREEGVIKYKFISGRE